MNTSREAPLLREMVESYVSRVLGVLPLLKYAWAACAPTSAACCPGSAWTSGRA